MGQCVGRSNDSSHPECKPDGSEQEVSASIVTNISPKILVIVAFVCLIIVLIAASLILYFRVFKPMNSTSNKGDDAKNNIKSSKPKSKQTAAKTNQKNLGKLKAIRKTTTKGKK